MISTELYDYLRRPHETGWRDGVLRSQVWRGIPWDHDLVVCVPSSQEGDAKHDQDSPESACILLITGGPANPTDLTWCQRLADESSLPVAGLFHIPAQPLFDRTEDDLIAFTFDQYLETGEEDWPLLFPMVQAAVAAMNELPYERFIVTGASKRGWTSWLVGCLGDPRVVGIAPEVFDNLNMGAQMAQQLTYWGHYSPMIEPYVSEDLPQRLGTPEVQQLAALVDPYTYLPNLNCPVYTIIGTNDPYWTVDSIRLYWDAVPGQKWIDYAPNCGHTIGDRSQPRFGLAGFARGCAGLGPWPSEEGALETWWSWSPNRQFADAEWSQEPMPQLTHGTVATFQRWVQGDTVSCSPMVLRSCP